MPEPPRQNLEAEDDARNPPWRHLVRLVLRNWAWHEEDLRPEGVQLLLFKVSLVVSAVPRTLRCEPGRYGRMHSVGQRMATSNMGGQPAEGWTWCPRLIV